MIPELTANLLCIFSLIHNSALAQANTLAWAFGSGTGLFLAGFAGTRMRHGRTTSSATRKDPEP